MIHKYRQVDIWMYIYIYILFQHVLNLTPNKILWAIYIYICIHIYISIYKPYISHMYHLGISRAPSHGSSVIRGAKMPSPWRRRPSGSRCWGWPQRPPIPRSGGCTTGKTPWDFKPANLWKEYGFYYQLYIYILYIYEELWRWLLDETWFEGTSWNILHGFTIKCRGFLWVFHTIHRVSMICCWFRLVARNCVPYLPQFMPESTRILGNQTTEYHWFGFRRELTSTKTRISSPNMLGISCGCLRPCMMIIRT